MSTVIPKPHREMVWTSVYGQETRICDMPPDYLANLYQYLDHRKEDVPEYEGFYVELMAVIDEERKERGVTDTFMQRAQHPYRNPRGILEIWDFKLGRPVAKLEAV